MQQSAVAPARPLARLRDHKAPLAVGAVVRVATKVRYGLVAVFLPMLHARAASRRSPELRTIAAVYAIAAVCALGVLAAGTSVVACAVRGVSAIVRAQRHPTALRGLRECDTTHAAGPGPPALADTHRLVSDTGL